MPPAPVTQAERPRGFGEVEVEARRAVLEAGSQATQEPHRRGAENPQPVLLDVCRARVEPDVVEDLVGPSADVEDLWGKAKLRVHVEPPRRSRRVQEGKKGTAD